MYSKEQLKELEQIGQTISHFATVTQSGFKRGSLIKEDNAVADIYEAATGTKVERTFGCKTCCYNFYKKAAELYYESKKYYEEQEKKEEEQAGDEIVELVTNLKALDGKPKKTTTAKKKTTTNKKKTTTKK